MKKLFYLCLILFGITGCNMTTTSPQTTPTAHSNNKSAVQNLQTLFTLSTQDRTFEGKHYRLFIATPKQHKSAKILYLLDGNAHFPLALQMIDPTLPLPTIIAVGYPTTEAYAVAERTRDYTFATSGAEFQQGGGAADFLRFFSDELQPHFITQVSHNTATPMKQIFFGHSFGGLFGLFSLFQQPQRFDEYVLASPSLWWGDGALLQQKPAVFLTKPRSVTLTLSEYEQNPNADPQRDPTRRARILQRRKGLTVEQLNTILQRDGINSRFILIANTNHGSSAAPALAIALQKAQQK
ncbi:alpha/beta hydrolase [Testudinibacter sp. TR-2022]|nr:alpha/beta hydrolase [Pasteurellaceae bacterium Phil31]TNH05039.1 alpha/beta hydrolase [Testudinibacter sp. TR-2022]TNH07089.1 alpha/beta hydrolase [Testudinibacter sp. TR-2022]TNH11809.1 alpha/beta hydrolase [Testudinibacter sp. TR-2022]TNH18339.1 alpha/beta hydrolase [Testudinibacter sp. TR-2022]